MYTYTRVLKYYLLFTYIPQVQIWLISTVDSWKHTHTIDILSYVYMAASAEEHSRNLLDVMALVYLSCILNVSHQQSESCTTSVDGGCECV